MDITAGDSPETSWETLSEQIRSLVPDLSDKALVKLLG